MKCAVVGCPNEEDLFEIVAMTRGMPFKVMYYLCEKHFNQLCSSQNEDISVAGEKVN